MHEAPSLGATPSEVVEGLGRRRSDAAGVSGRPRAGAPCRQRQRVVASSNTRWRDRGRHPTSRWRRPQVPMCHRNSTCRPDNMRGFHGLQEARAQRSFAYESFASLEVAVQSVAPEDAEPAVEDVEAHHVRAHAVRRWGAAGWRCPRQARQSEWVVSGSSVGWSTCGCAVGAGGAVRVSWGGCRSVARAARCPAAAADGGHAGSARRASGSSGSGACCGPHTGGFGGACATAGSGCAHPEPRVHLCVARPAGGPARPHGSAARRAGVVAVGRRVLRRSVRRFGGASVGRCSA